MTRTHASGHASRPEDADGFARRHIGPGGDEIAAMLRATGHASLEALTDAAIPESIRMDRPLALDPPCDEAAVLAELAALASRNQLFKSFIGMGYHDCVTPPVLLRNILENPGWYTAYTPYQAEVAQGRLEALLNFQTMIMDLTGMELANASLLDEGTAAAEAMAMCHAVKGGPDRNRFLVAADCHPQTIDVVRTRARMRGIEVVVANPDDWELGPDVCGGLVQVPGTDGTVRAYADLAQRLHDADALLAVAADPLALTVLEPPGAWGADIAVGSTQRFGVPMGFGGPHAAYFATREAYRRQMPGRIVGVSRDAEGRPAVRLALQTREQHIRREKATSNICTAQVLLAVIASMYAVYHGPEGLLAIARRVHRRTLALAEGLRRAGHGVSPDTVFDTVTVRVRSGGAAAVLERARHHGMNLRPVDDERVGITLDETTTLQDVDALLAVFDGGEPSAGRARDLEREVEPGYPPPLARTSPFLEHPVFHRYRSETEMMRYLKRLEARDLSLTTSMIPLGSCTMKLNAAAQMLPITWPGFARLHPFAPAEQTQGYLELFDRLERWLAEITGFAAVSLQPNSGAQGEYTGLVVIRGYHEHTGQGQRDVCLIPASAHGTNPASAVMAGLRVVVVATDQHGNIDVADLRAKAEANAEHLAALMVTYPSTHGIFEAEIRTVCDIVHQNGGQVYLDGANMNAMVGLVQPAAFGTDVCHLNLHKTFCIPHGGGGPGMGPICVAAHLAPYLPGHAVVATGGPHGLGAVSAAPWGSPSILPISYAYIRMMGADGLRLATQVAILSANYCATRLEEHFPVLYRGLAGTVAHECIIDPRPLKAETGVTEMDIAKRLMDFGFHAPTVSFPVAGTLMIEPTESESKAELDRFCDALIAIRAEIAAVAAGVSDRERNPLKMAPHTAAAVVGDDWDRPYGREQGAFPAPWTREHKFWPSVARIDDPYGDRHLICACPPVEDYEAP